MSHEQSPDKNRPLFIRPERNGEPPPYHGASHFVGQAEADAAYQEAPTLSRDWANCDLSAFRLPLKARWHVAVVGRMPSEDIQVALGRILSADEPIELPPDVLTMRTARRRTAVSRGQERG